MNTLKYPTILGLLLLGCVFGYFLQGQSLGFSHPRAQTTVYASGGNILESSKIKEVYSYLQQYFYGFDTKTPTEKEDAMIDALTKSLGDKHTSYFNPKDAAEFAESLSGDFEGIGAVIKEHPKGIQIMKVLKDSPAAKSNLKKGDVITHVGNTSVVGMLASDAVEIIRGPKGSPVTLTILSDNQEKEVQIIRDQVVVPSIYSETLSGTTLGYIEIGFFGEHTADEFSQAFEELIGSGVTGIIIDARNNGGGYLDASVDALSMLLPPNKTAVVTRGIDPEQNSEYITKKKKQSNTTIPVVMIVNNMSASATEIMAGALQDYDRAMLVGEKTYGKGSVQEPFVLSDGSMLKITVAKWFTPKDRMIDKEGIKPDILIDLTDADYTSGYDRQLEGAKKVIQDMINKGGDVTLYKKDTTAIQSQLEEKKNP